MRQISSPCKLSSLKISHDPLGVFASWNHSVHFCKWWGVTCGRCHQRVIELDLHSSKLQGSLSPHVGNLSFLRTLDLQNNSFSYHIPQELGCLFRLQRLSLGNNTFSGVILFLDLQAIYLTGKLPVELGKLSKLEVLGFSWNNITGEIPHSFGNLTSIMIITGMYNYLQGGIPINIAELKRLTSFSLFSNELSGMIPSSIYNISSLITYDVAINRFHGSLPSNLFQTLPNLEGFFIGDNQFSGQIPVSFSNASHLLQVYMGTNRFIGKVPTLAGLHNLWRLSVAGNYLGGEADDLSFLYPLVNNTNLELLGMSDNNFSGALPEILSNFSTTLRRMTFGRNQIRGRIPTEISNLIGLEILGFERNQLEGIIPYSIGNLQNLGGLSLHNNNITGNIPSSLGNITSLIELDLSSNKLQGRVPSSLGNCQNLLGLLPVEVDRLTNLGILDISNNKLWGEIPRTLASCQSLESLYMSGNSFQGNVPDALSSLKAIRSLDLSHNNFTGKIPNFLADFELLMELDLSFNGFEGEVPVKGVFKNATEILIVGNKNLCGGIPELNLPKCSFHESKQKSSTKKLLIITISCGCLGIALMMCFLLVYYMRKEKKFHSESSLKESLQRVTYEDLRQATEGFSSSNLIGSGSFGFVYKGILNSNGMIVAIKVFNFLHKGALKSFTVKCKALTIIRHRNLVKVLIVCSSIDFQGNDFKALIYEFMANGSLDKWLHPVHTSNQTDEPRHLNLVQRLNIAVDVVSALDYLHHHCEMPIVHCDLKPNNVLLDDDMTARVGDFGIARFLQGASQNVFSNQSSSIGLKGTIGYAAPEYGMGSEVSIHGDTYSFGILLLELFTGKRPTDNMFKDGMNLHNFAKEIPEDCVLEFVDPLLLKEHEQMSVSTSGMRNNFGTQKYRECLSAVLKVGVACSEELPRDRMDVITASAELHRIKDILLRPAGAQEVHKIISLPP